MLASTRSTLQRFYFDQGLNNHASKRHIFPRRNQREVDWLFREWILHVLLEALWLQMRSVELKGVQSLMDGNHLIKLRRRAEQLQIWTSTAL